MTLIQHGLSGQIYYYYRCYFSLNFNFTFYHPDDNFILGRYNVGKEKKEFTEFRHCRAASAYKDNMCPREIEGSRVLQTQVDQLTPIVKLKGGANEAVAETPVFYLEKYMSSSLFTSNVHFHSQPV